jgi:hypothetical protein
VTEIPEVTVEPYVYRVSPFPPNTEAGRHWAAWLRSDGRGRWVVLSSLYMQPEEYLAADGKWTYSRKDKIRHDFDTAKALAVAVIPGIRVNGYTIEDAAERWNKRGDDL